MINTEQCIIEHPIENLDTQKWQELVNMMAELFNAASGVIVQYRQNTFNVIATSDNEDNFLSVNSQWPWDMKSFCRRIVETKDKLYINDALNDAEWSDAPPVASGPVRSYLGYPLYWPNGELFGSFCVIDTKSTNYSSPLKKILGQLKLIVESELVHIADIIKTKALLAEKIKQEKLLKKLALYDQLTECANRSLLTNRINYQIATAYRNKSAFSILLFDLDKFKPINDNYGHLCGDLVLSTIGKRIKETIRESDTIARIGGDEFVILMNCRINENKIKEKLLSVIEEDIHYKEQIINVSASIGIANYPDNGTTLAALLESADKNMYDKKLKDHA